MKFSGGERKDLPNAKEVRIEKRRPLVDRGRKGPPAWRTFGRGCHTSNSEGGRGTHPQRVHLIEVKNGATAKKKTDSLPPTRKKREGGVKPFVWEGVLGRKKDRNQ